MKTLNFTEKEFYNFISHLSDSEKRLLKDTIKHGWWGDVDFEFRVNSNTITSHCYGYITNEAKLGGNFSGREVSSLFRRLYKKICPYKGDQKKCKWGLGDIISHYSNWWGDGSGDVLFIREDAVDFFEKWAKTEEEPNQEPETKEEVEITENDIKCIGDNIFHIVYSVLIKNKGNSKYTTFNHKEHTFIKRSWDEKSLFILSDTRVYPLDAVEKYLSKDGRTVQDVFELWTRKAIEQYDKQTKRWGVSPFPQYLFSGIDCENEGKKRVGSLIEYPDGKCVIVEFDNNGEELSWDVIPESVELRIIKE